jgi:hypothetical protein
VSVKSVIPVVPLASDIWDKTSNFFFLSVSHKINCATQGYGDLVKIKYRAATDSERASPGLGCPKTPFLGQIL